MHPAPTRIEIWRAPSPSSMRVAGDFGAIVRSDRLPTLLRSIGDLGGVSLAAVEGGELRGYATIVPSSALARERWENLPDTFELGSIEVARSSRGRGIGTALLARLGATLPVERLILFARGFAGHWETATLGISPVDYRRMLLRMLGRAGFQRWDTDDPEVSDHPLNFLAVRAGRHAPSASLVAIAERALAGGASPWW